jgi:hypothetical protein
MKNFQLKKELQAQSMLEYILLVGMIVVALTAMTQAIKRGTQSIVKTAADELSYQQNADQTFSNTTGYLNSQNSTVQEDNQKQIVERVGIINYVRNEAALIESESLTNMGFTEDQ